MNWLIKHPRAFLAIAYVGTTTVVGLITLFAITTGELLPILDIAR